LAYEAENVNFQLQYYVRAYPKQVPTGGK